MYFFNKVRSIVVGDTLMVNVFPSVSGALVIPATKVVSGALVVSAATVVFGVS